MADGDDKERRTIISSNTMVSVSLLGMIVGGAVWATKLDGRVANMERGIEEIKEKIRDVNVNAIDRDILDGWMRVFKAQNPTISVPDLR